MGYTSTYSSTVTIARGSDNYISPSRYDGAQPTTFKPGTKHGVFAYTVTAFDAGSPTRRGTWTVSRRPAGGATVSASCPLPTQLPAQGNDTGAGIALLVAGAIGVLVVVRLRRRALAAVSQQGASQQEPGERLDA